MNGASQTIDSFRRAAHSIRVFASTILRAMLLPTMLCLAACAPDTRSELVIYVRNTTPAQNKIWIGIAERFQSTRPDLKVRLLNIPYDTYWPKLFTMISSGNPPDLVLMESGFYPSFVAKNAFLDLAPLIRDTPGFSLDRYYPEALKWLWVGDKIYGLPTDIAVILPFYNKDLFDRCQVPYPKEGWTWQDYLETAKKLTRDLDGDGKIDVWGTAMPPWEIVLWSSGGEIVDNPEMPMRCTFNSPLHAQAISWIFDIREKFKVTPKETDLTAQIDPFIIQKVAMIWTGHWSVPDYRQRTSFNWDVAPLPAGSNGTAGYNFGSSFCIPATSRHPREAWEAVQFFCGPEGLKFMVELDLITPALRELAESPVFLDRTPPEHHGRFLDAIASGRIYPKSPRFHEFRQMINSQLESVWAKQTDVATACNAIARRGTEILMENEE